ATASGQDHRADFVVMLNGAKLGEQAGHHIGAERIETVGPVERQVQDAVTAFDQEVRVIRHAFLRAVMRQRDAGGRWAGGAGSRRPGSASVSHGVSSAGSTSSNFP